MGTYGASGGYWVSSQASAIVAQPSTLTGSIGVFGGKFDVGPALARFGVDVRQVGVGGQYAGAFGLGNEFTPAQRAAFSHWMDRIYDNFVARVAAGVHYPGDIGGSKPPESAPIHTSTRLSFCQVQNPHDHV